MGHVTGGEVSLGTFTLSLDTELIWGSFDHLTQAEFERQYPDIRSTIGEIIRRLERYEISATWAVVGHLFLSECHRSSDGLAHPELARPQQSWRAGDWYTEDPCSGLDRHPLWYGPDIVDMLQAARTDLEIGCHSFSHVLYGDRDMTQEAVDADLEACVDLARQRGIELRSFVFPRNSEGHHGSLARHGFRAYRGVEPTRYRTLPGPLHRTAHLASHVVGMTPPVSAPYEIQPGLWNIPGSSLILHRAGLRRAVRRRRPLRSR